MELPTIQFVSSYVPVPTTCKNCNLVLPSKMQHHKHMKTCKPKFPCEKCELVFKDKKELGSNFRPTHALTYFSTQARTIHGGIRLAQTSHNNFTLRDLVLALGRAPRGCDVQVEA